MLKQFRPSQHSGAKLWDEHWRKYDAIQYDAGNLRWDGILDLVDRRLFAGTWLEAGCGLGKYVLYAASRDADIVGIDFVPHVLARIRAHRTHAKLAVGDLARLPFTAAAFDTVLCLGVLEHFEDGAEEQVTELVRVLRPGGWLIVTVPYANLLKRRRVRRGVGDVCDYRAAPPNGWTFYQYCYSRSEARSLVADAGLDVIHDRRISRLFWLLGGRTASSRTPARSPAPNPGGNTEPRAALSRSLARRFVREASYHLQRFIPPDWTSHMIAVVGRKPVASIAGRER